MKDGVTLNVAVREGCDNDTKCSGTLCAQEPS